MLARCSPWRRARRATGIALPAREQPCGAADGRRSALEADRACGLDRRATGRDAGADAGEVRSGLAGRGVEVSYASVWRTVRKLGLRHEKRTIHATGQDRPDVAIAREIWRAAQAGLDFDRLIFVDETGTTTSMTRLRGWARRASRCRARHRTVTG